ncbi:MAG: flagellar basal body P-ring formation chaperone FlgA [Sulfuricurvum sp.]|jgi:flagella basal body P-ring formation protein FlgA|nr:flagellar basal body P-ring formation chaperone FlgA [Sulfuricurvum sp.]MDP3021795.1 flagellar basal body P-ring formation chaperone FlgA [Sulfuricurvum sp.]MDP3120172.1 flagellar basal body P-ring formation chaperone FlgA [Sulfuricurvum sp.]
MYLRLVTFLFLFFATAQCDTLKQAYTFKEPKIYSSDLINGCSNRFEILQIPDGKTTYRINAEIIAKTFELNGCSIDVGKVRYVNFTKQTSLDLTKLKQQLTDVFISAYPRMNIEKIDIFPRGFIESIPENSEAVLDPDITDKNNGIFYVLDKSGVRRYFDFSLEASLNILHSNQKINRNQVLSSTNSTLKSLPFTQFRGKPLSTLPDQTQRFRRSLRENTPIVDRYLEPLPIVLKGSKVSVQVKNGLVIVEFIATATQEGALYDIITIEKSDKKRAKAKVIGENRVELQ